MRFIGLALMLLTLSNCARNIGSDEYAEDNIGQVKQSYRGMIISARKVKVSGSDSLGGNTAGIVGGGAAGALLGSQFGKGRGATLGTLIGAAAGAVGGAFAEKALKEQEGMEYTVELKSGRILSVVQGPKPPLQVGQHVIVLVGSKGRSRVILDQSGGMTYAQSQKAKGQTPDEFNEIDQNHRDAYARDVVERTSGPKAVIQTS